MQAVRAQPQAQILNILSQVFYVNAPTCLKRESLAQLGLGDLEFETQAVGLKVNRYGALSDELTSVKMAKVTIGPDFFTVRKTGKAVVTVKLAGYLRLFSEYPIEVCR